MIMPDPVLAPYNLFILRGQQTLKFPSLWRIILYGSINDPTLGFVGWTKLEDQLYASQHVEFAYEVIFEPTYHFINHAKYKLCIQRGDVVEDEMVWSNDLGHKLRVQWDSHSGFQVSATSHWLDDLPF